MDSSAVTSVVLALSDIAEKDLHIPVNCRYLAWFQIFDRIGNWLACLLHAYLLDRSKESGNTVHYGLQVLWIDEKHV